MSSDKYINEDTYQTLQDISVEPQSDFVKATTPLWANKKENDIEIFVATPVHSECSIHYERV